MSLLFGEVLDTARRFLAVRQGKLRYGGKLCPTFGNQAATLLISRA